MRVPPNDERLPRSGAQARPGRAEQRRRAARDLQFWGYLRPSPVRAPGLHGPTRHGFLQNVRSGDAEHFKEHLVFL